MKRILCISGSRADYGLLEWPVKVLREAFEINLIRLNSANPPQAYEDAYFWLSGPNAPDCLLILGDRWEILQCAIAAHLLRVPIAHIGGGDVTLGSYDDAMRDCISRLATWHFVTSQESYDRLDTDDRSHVYMIGNIAIDYIRHGDWKRGRPYPTPYVVVNYQPETIDRTIEWDKVLDSVAGRNAIYIMPNRDIDHEIVRARIIELGTRHGGVTFEEAFPHGAYLNLIYYCEELIGNSSSMLYEAPELGVKCRMIGKRQAGRVVPTGDGKASERIKEILCRCL